MRRYYIHDAQCGLYAVTSYGTNKRDALNRYRAQWYPNKTRLPNGIAIWEA